MDRFEYRNFFTANIAPRQGTLLVSGDVKMDGDYCQNYTIKLSHAFWKDIQAYCTGPSMAMNFCYLLDTGINSLLKREKCLLVSAVNSVSVMKKEGDYIVDIRQQLNLPLSLLSLTDCFAQSMPIPSTIGFIAANSNSFFLIVINCVPWNSTVATTGGFVACWLVMLFLL